MPVEYCKHDVPTNCGCHECMMDEIRAALRAYHHALDTRQHGGVAAGALANEVERILGTPWKQGATLEAERCLICGGSMAQGIAIKEAVTTEGEHARYDGVAPLSAVWKCERCGHSFTVDATKPIEYATSQALASPLLCQCGQMATRALTIGGAVALYCDKCAPKPPVTQPTVTHPPCNLCNGQLEYDVCFGLYCPKCSPPLPSPAMRAST